MVGRALRGLALWLGLYILFSLAHFGVLYGLNALRSGLEQRWESQFGAEVIDREPPYSLQERVVIALDIQPSMYWVESLAMSFIMSLPVALFVGLGALLLRRARRGTLLIIATFSSLLVFYLLYLLGEQVFAGYLVGHLGAIGVSGIGVGFVQGLIAGMVLRNGKG
ncbi:MAG: hypothetical protein SNJ72_06540 [Fimbriimonadales bacterium]